MNIGCTLAHSLLNHRFYQLYDRGVVDIIAVDILLLRHLARLFFYVLFECGVYLCLSVITVESQHHIPWCCHDRLHLQVRNNIDIVHGSHVHWI